jgi:sulfur-oxidizing protein SoxY
MKVSEKPAKIDQRRGIRRRRLLLGASAGALLGIVRPAGATPESMAAAIKEAFGDSPIQSGRVKLDIPRIAENGNSVPLTVSVESPMSAGDYVKSILVFAEKNPLPTVAEFHLSPRSGRAQVASRIRLAAASQRLLAVASMSDGTRWSGSAEVIVTASACVGD